MAGKTINQAGEHISKAGGEIGSTHQQKIRQTKDLRNTLYMPAHLVLLILLLLISVNLPNLTPEQRAYLEQKALDIGQETQRATSIEETVGVIATGAEAVTGKTANQEAINQLVVAFVAEEVAVEEETTDREPPVVPPPPPPKNPPESTPKANPVASKPIVSSTPKMVQQQVYAKTSAMVGEYEELSRKLVGKDLVPRTRAFLLLQAKQRARAARERGDIATANKYDNLYTQTVANARKKLQQKTLQHNKKIEELEKRNSDLDKKLQAVEEISEAMGIEQ